MERIVHHYHVWERGWLVGESLPRTELTGQGHEVELKEEVERVRQGVGVGIRDEVELPLELASEE